jgi:NADPH:quinone reductase-like Zn-dependent oxidoreductase
VIVHLAGDGAALAELLSAKGRLASTLGLGSDQHPAATAVMATPTADTLDRLAADVAAGRITVPVARTYPLADVPAAFGDFASGTLGKLALTIA